uniref:Uncharacterized protein n=1 Tax=Cucumis melo TaxID=3656 RepID=A0A9I9EDP8_CUCME
MIMRLVQDIMMDVGPSTSYMHGHGCGYGEHNEYLCEALADVSYQQE